MSATTPREYIRIQDGRIDVYENQRAPIEVRLVACLHQLGAPAVIKVRNEDTERHDFGTTMFEGIPTQIEKDGVIVYGRGVGGVFLDPKRDASIRFNLTRPGRLEFRCSIHPNMAGELLLLSVET